MEAKKSAVGTATAISVDPSDPKNPRLEIEVGKPLSKATTLAEIKANKLFAGSPLVREGRLSVVPLTKAQYDAPMDEIGLNRNNQEFQQIAYAHEA